MINITELKLIATPQSVARYFLGTPMKEHNNELWYKSPFRQEEKIASFIVSDKGFHDFGTNRHYDIIAFVEKLKNCGFKEAVNILGTLYGVGDDYDARKLQKWLAEQKKQNDIYKRKVENNFLALWDALEAEKKVNDECIEILKGDLEDDGYKICLDKRFYIDGFIEHLVFYTDTFKEKESLFKQVERGDIPVWLKWRLKNNAIY